MGIQPGVSITALLKVSQASQEPGLQIILRVQGQRSPSKEGIQLLNHRTALQC